MAKTAFVLVFSVALCCWGEAGAGELDFKALSLIPIQEGGRVKPLDTFARESVRMVTGKEKFEGRYALDLLLDWMAHPETWAEKDLILVENLELRGRLGIPKAQKRVAPLLLLKHEGFLAYAKSSHAKQEKKMTLDPVEKEALTVFGRLDRFKDIESGEALALVPAVFGSGEKWASIGGLQDAYRRDKKRMPEPLQEALFAFAGVLRAYDGKNAPAFRMESANLSGVLARIGEKDQADPFRLKMEGRFNSLKPFRKAWILHLAAALLAGLSFLFSRPKWINGFYRPAFLLFTAGIAISLYGFILRCLVAGRPPVTNMYESLIWVTFVMTVLALVFERVARNRLVLLAASLLAWVGFVLADNVPNVLDPAIQPIEPVLRSNFWLTIHVLTITSSYAAFLLALGVGHVCLWFFWFRAEDREGLRKFTQLLYRVVQVGVVLLAAGTILGGVWANYSWGRFWGWDPKETWALIALLGYVAILHGRLAGWLRELGFTIGVVLAFLGVLMAWYGVNFVLGVGLHSYGFSQGGLGYVLAFVAVELILVTVVALKARKAI